MFELGAFYLRFHTDSMHLVAENNYLAFTTIDIDSSNEKKEEIDTSINHSIDHQTMYTYIQ